MAVTGDMLRDVPLLAGFRPRELDRLAPAFRERTVPAGQTFLREGEGGIAFFIVLEGDAEVSVGGDVRGTLRAGDHLGEIALLAPEAARSATVTATTDLRLAALTAWDFKPFVLENPDVAWILLQTLARRLAQPSSA